MTEELDSIRHVFIFHEESGVCLYYHAFTDAKIDPQLVAGFLSAITSFGGKFEDTKAKKKGAATKITKHFVQTYDKALKDWKGDLRPFKDAGTMIVSDLS
jgi:hypothetical protein